MQGGDGRGGPHARGAFVQMRLGVPTIITDRKLVSEATRQKLGILVDKYFV